ncbi:MAG: hypothetical protein HQK96_14620 [Nitrospirae bacterium]|nr:hypothetical protein [Nitrospirota bacterium]
MISKRISILFCALSLLVLAVIFFNSKKSNVLSIDFGHIRASQQEEMAVMVDTDIVHISDGAKIQWKVRKILTKPVKWNLFELSDYFELVFNETNIECNFSESVQKTALSAIFMRILRMLTPNIDKELVVMMNQNNLNKPLTPDVKQPAKIFFLSILVTLHFPGGEWISIKADRAELEAFASRLSLKGNVAISTSSNERLSAKEIFWNLRDEIMETSGEYEFSTGKGIERGANRQFLLKNERIIRGKQGTGLPLAGAQPPVFTIMNSFAKNPGSKKMNPMQTLFFSPFFNNQKAPPF